MAAANPPETPETPQADPRVEALEQRIDTLTQVIQQRGDQDGQLAMQIQGLQNQLGRIGQTTNQPEQVEPTEEFKRFYQDMPGYIKQVALEANREVLGPHLANQAVQTRDALLYQAREQVDAEHGEGFWDERVATAVGSVLNTLPLEMQASRLHVGTAVESVLGKLYLDPTARSEMETRRSKRAKEREEANNMLPNGRPRPPRPDQLDDRERGFLDSLGRSGFDVTEAQYKAAKGAGRTIDEWRASRAATTKK